MLSLRLEPALPCSVESSATPRVAPSCVMAWLDSACWRFRELSVCWSSGFCRVQVESRNCRLAICDCRVKGPYTHMPVPQLLLDIIRLLLNLAPLAAVGCLVL